MTSFPSRSHGPALLLALSGALLLPACGTDELTIAETGAAVTVSEDGAVRGRRVHVTREAGPARTRTSNLTDHGGAVLPTFHIYTIYWGTGFGATTQALYTSFLQGLGSSGYWTINTQYLRGAANNTSYGGSYSDTSTPPATVQDGDLQGEVHKVLSAGGLPADPNGVYHVITPKTVKVCSGSQCSCTSFCGYHSNYADSSYGNLYYSTIPSGAACPASCGMFSSDATSPNGNVEADEGVSILAHESEETQSDAQGTAWFDRQGEENADKCAYKYGPTTIGGHGAKVNQGWNGYSWLVQMNWSNRISGCAQKGPTDGPYSN